MARRSWLTSGRIKLAAAALLIAMLAAVAPSARAQNAVGSITELAGSAQYARAGQIADVKPGMAVELHDKLSTGAGAHLTVTLQDNSRLTLTESSTLVIDESVLGPSGGRASTKVSLLGGSLHALVSAGLRGAAPSFQVETPNAIAGVRGTDFTISYTNTKPTGP